jgi:uncharacterized protein (DUF433 family)
VHHPRITADPAVMMGKPSVKDTRITVELILRKLGAGRSFFDLLEAYPQLTEEDLRAALAFAAGYMERAVIPAAVWQKRVAAGEGASRSEMARR